MSNLISDVLIVIFVILALVGADQAADLHVAVFSVTLFVEKEIFNFHTFSPFSLKKYDQQLNNNSKYIKVKVTHYRKLVETFHGVSECNTAVCFSWCLVQALAQPVQLFWSLVTFGVASGNSLTDSDLQLFIETEQDRTRHTFIQ